ncbi:MAG: FG-GAP-like repeat-containing protein [Pirellulaceae bacterium]
MIWFSSDPADPSGFDPISHHVGVSAFAVDGADIDNDDDTDLVYIRRSLENSVMWVPNQGNGEFGEPVEVTPHVRNAATITVGDIDGNGTQDIVVGTTAGRLELSLSVFFNADDGESFSERLIVSENTSRAVTLQDIDGDGDLDLAGSGINSIYWHENLDGKGNFGEAILIADGLANPRATASGDFDEDGDIDLVFVDYVADGGSVSLYENPGNSQPSWNRHLLTETAKGPIALAAADFDNDQDLDIAVTSAGDDSVFWLENMDGFGTFSGARSISGGAGQTYVLQAADLDSDGDLDAIAASFLDGKLVWYENSDGPHGRFSTQRIISTQTEGVLGFHTVDFDGDGDLDVFSASVRGDKWAWHENLDGKGNFTEHIVSFENGSRGASAITTADVDGDGDLDVLATARYSSMLAWVENLDGKGTFSIFKSIDNQFRSGHAVQAIDVDQDGDLDVVAAKSYVRFGGEGSQIIWYENDGHGGFIAAYSVMYIPILGLTAFDAFDIDEDGDTDIVVSSSNDDTIAWFENPEAKADEWAAHIVTTQALQAQAVVARDLDGDGRRDLVVTAYGNDRIEWYRNEGRGTFSELPVILTDQTRGPTALAVEDLTGNGKFDLLVSSSLENSLTWYRNDSPTRGDVDNNGLIEPTDLDLICVAISADDEDELFDINFDGDVNFNDVSTFLDEIAKTVVGDVNLDGVFDSSDLVLIFQSGKFETEASAAWSQGDWNCDGQFTTQDLVFAFQDGRYFRG